MARARGCRICKRLIEAERAEHYPETELCAEHAREIEKFGGEFILSGSQERTSKPTSIKPFFGSVSVSRRKNEAGMQKLLDEFDRQQFERQQSEQHE